MTKTQTVWRRTVYVVEHLRHDGKPYARPQFNNGEIGGCYDASMAWRYDSIGQATIGGKAYLGEGRFRVRRLTITEELLPGVD